MRKDPTAFRERFKKWKETGEYELPKFAGGTEGYKYVQAGKNDEWSRITNDDMSLAFLDLIIRPLSRGGNTTVGNWNRQWSPKYEKPLESVYPEFDIISLSQATSKIAKEIKRFKNWGGVEFDYNRGGLIKFSYLDRNRNRLGHIDVRTYDGKPEISMVRSNTKGAGRKLYDAAIEYVINKDMPGIYSGKNLLSAPKTYSMWKHYPSKLLVGMNGVHSNFNMPEVTGVLSRGMSKEQAILNWSKNLFGGFNNGEIYLLKSPSDAVKYWQPYSADITSTTPLINPIIRHNITE